MSAIATEVKPSKNLPAGLIRLGAGPESRTSKSNNRLVFRAAEKTIEFVDHLCSHYRETRRMAVDIPCEVSLLLPDGKVFDSGTAVVRNVSPSGALLAGLSLSKSCLPVGVFRLVIKLTGGDYKGIGLEATPVRLIPEASGLGVKFDEVFVNA
ncbi:MAG TPA: PilZ domain-containing protein [Planctomycetota bacterium]|jgi:hypothetical protein